MKNLFSILLAAFLLSSCGPSLVTVAIDNPTNDFIEISIDSLDIQIAPMEVAWVEMGKGNHIVTVQDTVAEFNFQSEAYFLNPTFSEYLLYEEVYGANDLGMGASGGTLPVKTITYFGMELEGRYDVVKDLINPVRWEYGPREQTPEMIEMDAGDMFAYVTKLADVNEMLGDMMSGSEESY